MGTDGIPHGGTPARESHAREETPGGCSLGRVKSDETIGIDVAVRSLYCDLGNVERIVELFRINLSKFSIPFILIHSN